jgi:DNA-binding response OmpR family regulator
MQDGKHVILCIDDDPDIRMYLKTVLEANGYLPVEAPSAEEGLRAYKKHKPDLVIVDLMMEEVDAGTSFAKELKALGNEAPVYMLSSVADGIALNVDYNELGLSGAIQKPIAADKLLALLQSKLG